MNLITVCEDGTVSVHGITEKNALHFMRLFNALQAQLLELSNAATNDEEDENDNEEGDVTNE